MSKNRSPVSNPNQRSRGFLWALIALVVVVVSVVGYVVYQGEQARKPHFEASQDAVNFEVSYADNVIEMKSPNAKKDAKVVEFYEDYSCPHCAELAEKTDGEMKNLIESGDIVVHIRSLNFLDGEDASEGNSTRAGTVAYLVARSGEAAQYWNLRAAMFAQQSKIYGKWKLEDFATAAEGLGVDSKVRDEINAGDGAAEFVNIARANYAKLKEETGQVSSPRVFVDGKEVDSAFDWLDQVK